MSAYAGTDNLEVMACAANYNAFLLDLLVRQLKAGDRILDFGAGIGTFARRLSALGHEVACVEPDARQCATVSQLGIRCEPAIDAYAPASFDFVYSFNVLEHIGDDVAALRALRSRMAPSGRLFLYVPAFPFLFSSMDRKVGHLRRYTARTLRAAVEQAGFRPERGRYADCLGVAATIAYKWIGDPAGNINERALVAYDRFAFPVSRALDTVLGALIGKNVWMLATPVPQAAHASR
jgi:SAM-dependent methyltransferase